MRIPILLALLLSIAAARAPASAAPIGALGITYAYYDPLSLILKNQGTLQKALGPDVQITWVLSQGSNKALEFLRGNSVQFGQTAGSAALLGRANGAPVQAIAITATSEWTAIVVPPNSPIHGLADLKGKRVAATPGTDPNIFLFRALATVGLAPADITLVPLQHPLGRQALDAGQVDAWAGLDPFMAEAQLQNHDVLVYRDKALISPGTLLVREDFAAAHPEIVKQVLAAYAQARAYAIAHPAEMAQILSSATGLSQDITKLQLTRIDFHGQQIGPAQRQAILAAGPILQSSGKLSPGANLAAAAATLVNTSFTSEIRSK
jgi:sulfonate transport system substrate-binding protein